MAEIVTIDGIPVYQALVEEGDGMMRISLVDDPAVQSNFQAFSKEGRKMLTYAVQDEEKRLVLGVVMRADFPIYRRDADGFEYFIIYKADTIRAMAEKYLAENRQNLVNLMHEDGTDVDGVQMVQYFIKGAGLVPAGFEEIADGSLFAEFHITNDEVWEAVKAGTYKGFSLEGYFTLTPEKDADLVQEIVDTLEGKFSKVNQFKKRKNMSKVKGLLARLAAALVEMGNTTTDKGVLSWDGEDDLKAGDAVYIVDGEGNRTPAEDGDYTTEDGKVISVAGGVVTEIKDNAAQVEPQGNEPQAATAKMVQTDKGNLEWDGEDEDLKEGDAVYITDEEGNRNPAPDGEYTTEDGKVIAVVDGKVASITDPKAQVAAARAEKFKAVAVALQETYEDKYKKLYAAIEALGFAWPWIIEAGEEFVIASIYTDNGEEVYYRFNIVEWNEDGQPVLENGVKVVPAFVTPEEKEAAEANFSVVKSEADTLRGEKEALAAQVAELQAEVEKLKAQPAGKPAHEEFNGGAEIRETGNKGLDRLARLVAKK